MFSIQCLESWGVKGVRKGGYHLRFRLSFLSLRLYLRVSIPFFSPFILLPALSYRENVLELTLVGQYIIKNLAILSALLFIYPEKQMVQQSQSIKSNPQVNLKSREVEAA